MDAKLDRILEILEGKSIVITHNDLPTPVKSKTVVQLKKKSWSRFTHIFYESLMISKNTDLNKLYVYIKLGNSYFMIEYSGHITDLLNGKARLEYIVSIYDHNRQRTLEEYSANDNFDIYNSSDIPI